MTRAHTQGPWLTVPRSAFIHNSAEVIVSEAWPIEPSGEEQAANAQLIAAAPDLLAALQDIFRHCALTHKYWGESSNVREADQAIANARGAIANAGGIVPEGGVKP